MFIIRKKRIAFLLLAVIISVASYGMHLKPDNTVPTVSLPVSNKTIVLDAGHGIPDEGDLLLHKENKQLTFYK